MNKPAPQSGQTLIALLVFMMLGITLALSAAMVIVVHIQSDIAYQSGEQALQNAQAGVENALLRLERDSTYTGETMTLSKGTATITISGTTTKTIVSVGASGKAVRTLNTTATLSGGAYSLGTWSEIP